MSSKIGFDIRIKRPNSFVVFQDINEIEEENVSLVREQVGSLQKILEAALFEDHKSIALRDKGKSKMGEDVDNTKRGFSPTISG